MDGGAGMKLRWIQGLLLSVLVLMAPWARADETVAHILDESGTCRLLVLGEYHGTREIPQLVARLVDADSAANRPVVLALEMPRGENVALARYMASDGRDEERRALRMRAFWGVTDDQHDGRRSHDMLALIDSMRALRMAGRDVQLFAYDLDASTHGNEVRDDAMAQALRARYAGLPADARMIVLTGNVHAMRTRPHRAPATLQQKPMAAQLADLGMFNVRIDAARGAFWGCKNGRCSAWPIREQPMRVPQRHHAPGRLYDLTVWLPQLSVAQLVD